MKRNFLVPLAAIAASILAACGGGGGGGSTANPPSNPNPAPIITSAPAVSGDMLALAPSRAWNYSDFFNATITLYADPQSLNGVVPLVGLAVSNPFASNAIGGTRIGTLGIEKEADGYHVLTFDNVSNGIAGPVPGSPLLAPNIFTQNEVSSPYPGVTETVIRIGFPDGFGACANLQTGATVQYIYGNQTYEIGFVPGCGITEFKAPSGDEYTLQSVASYPQLGELDRRTATASYFTLAKSLARRLLRH